MPIPQGYECGTKFRGSSLVKSNAVKSVEATYANASTHSTKIGDHSSRGRVLGAFPRRKKISQKQSWHGPVNRARICRLLLKAEKDPKLMWFLVAITATVAIWIGAVVIVLLFWATGHSHRASHSPRPHQHYTRHSSHSQPLMHIESRKEHKRHVHVHELGIHLVPERHLLESDKPQPHIFIDWLRYAGGKFFMPENGHGDYDEGGDHVDFGSLDMHIFEEDARRFIARDLSKFDTPPYRKAGPPFDDDVDAYYYDDDYLRGAEAAYDDKDEIVDTKHCRKIAEHDFNFQNCNMFHELDRSDPESGIKYLNEGGYREVFSMVNRVGNEDEFFAIKDTRYALDFAYNNYEYVRMDAIVAERLTASPRIYNIYGFCGLGIISEYFYWGDVDDGGFTGGHSGYTTQEELQDKEELKPKNNLTGIEKLVIAEQMAEAVADLHGYKNGLVIHDDIQLSQFLLNQDKTRLVLNDFNRAEFPLFDKENNEYCRFQNGIGSGNWRAPEEYLDKPLTEQIDVWSLGNNMYALLTGLNPLYEVDDQDEFARRIGEGDTAYIDPRYKDRSPGESALVDAISRCFVFDPKERINVFELAAFLRDAVTKLLGPSKTRESVLRGVKAAELPPEEAEHEEEKEDDDDEEEEETDAPTRPHIGD